MPFTTLLLDQLASVSISSVWLLSILDTIPRFRRVVGSLPSYLYHLLLLALCKSCSSKSQLLDLNEYQYIVECTCSYDNECLLSFRVFVSFCIVVFLKLYSFPTVVLTISCLSTFQYLVFVIVCCLSLCGCDTTPPSCTGTSINIAQKAASLHYSHESTPEHTQ